MFLFFENTTHVCDVFYPFPSLPALLHPPPVPSLPSLRQLFHLLLFLLLFVCRSWVGGFGTHWISMSSLNERVWEIIYMSKLSVATSLKKITLPPPATLTACPSGRVGPPSGAPPPSRMDFLNYFIYFWYYNLITFLPALSSLQTHLYILPYSPSHSWPLFPSLIGIYTLLLTIQQPGIIDDSSYV